MAETPMEPIFQDPPTTLVADQEWQPTVESLIANTGQWAIIYDEPYMGADYRVFEKLISRIRTARGAWAGESWEAMQRTIGSTRTLEQKREARVRVYARHVAAGPQGGAVG